MIWKQRHDKQPMPLKVCKVTKRWPALTFSVEKVEGCTFGGHFQNFIIDWPPISFQKKIIKGLLPNLFQIVLQLPILRRFLIKRCLKAVFLGFFAFPNKGYFLANFLRQT
ncbi:MAG: hypothetical protein H6577_02505 [Lewinellaceae bacterium]|nr:hypothetical protein [Saprospiraceae bacterium]MCB9336980.1 hypothetical protein [Lewinellaceae bacterium]